MRKDWDYVTLDDYRRDMAESSERASSIIAQLRERAEKAEKMLAEAIYAAGGKVTIGDHVLCDPHRRLEIGVMRDECNRTLIVTSTLTAEERGGDNG